MKLREFIPYTLICLLTSLSIAAFGQQSVVKGRVHLESGESVSHATIRVKGMDISSMSDKNGYYSLPSVPYGNQEIQVTAIEIQPKTVRLKVDKPTHDFSISVSSTGDIAIEGVEVSRMTEKKDMETSGFAVAVIETKEASLRNLTTNELLDRAVGVRVRQNGGVGSQVEYNLNGMSGSAIGIFLDGIEVATYGSSFNLNNIPPAMIERIEVYKGVLPSHLTGDYVGGAINVVLKKDASRNNATVAVSYGSFNTFNSDISLTLRDKKTGLSFRGSGFYTYTDNDYEMWGKFAKYTDRNGILTRNFRAKRFNDTYKSIGGRFEAGFTDVKWADQFFIGYNISDTYSEIPHGTTTAQPYVGRFTEYQAHVFSLNYNKRNLFVDGLALNINAVRSRRSTYVQDTVTTQYNWDGNPVILHTDYMIEAGDPPIVMKYPFGAAQQGQPSITQVDREILNARSNLSYTIARGHRVSLNYKLERTDRDDTNLLRPVNKDLLVVTQLTKNIVSANYEAQTLQNKLRTNLLVKYTANNTKQTDPKPTYNEDGSYELHSETKKTFNDNFGYGATISYSLLKDFFIITSFENSSIMPTEEQMYGNLENNILPNLSLTPEKNINYNIGFRWGSVDFGKHKVSFYGSGFWRNGYDKITRQTVDSIVTDNDMDIRATAFVNLEKIQSRGFEGEILYVFDNKLNAMLNFSKFNALYKRKYDNEGRPDDRYNLQNPNEPFFTINANLQYRLNNIFQRNSILNVYYNAGYVGAYDIAWYPSEGSLTPAQLSHDIGGSYRFPSGKLVASLDAKNIFNAALYDNFGVQKPGRGIYFKMNYTIGRF
ncbi:TonB-dependent receptor [Sphingobacterium corticibacterium]|uniref:TonB-dependent receptor n=1 Tax=Sphingobacterium corticibacterium TaxID=2484746 RepID=A0A4Q6XKW9_9SPHI|nr:TonB-dependent receptor plug domain-containing protein [Sphingobacterium corticibacterium]RZF60085.1 TonB-dependent receptor [Sphingobacterium corticibacterium]